jgi:hypothetical protein
MEKQHAFMNVVFAGFARARRRPTPRSAEAPPSLSIRGGAVGALPFGARTLVRLAARLPSGIGLKSAFERVQHGLTNTAPVSPERFSRAENYGVEQEHLNQVFGARLRITALKAERGPGIEFLEYITPPGRRPLPADANANDLVFWHTRLVAEGLDDFGAKLREQQTKFVSARAVTLSRGEVGSGPSHFAECDSGRRSVMMRDSDGHMVQFVENSPATAVSAR